MKLLKITVFILFVLNIAVPVFQSCVKEPPKTNSPVLENLVNTYNKGFRFEQDKAIFMEGEMTVITLLPSKEVLFFLKKENKPTTEIFLAQGAELPSNINKELGKVKVAYLREAMAIETRDGNIYTFTIGTKKANDLIQGLTPAWAGKGFGLAFWHNRSETPADYKGLTSTDDLYRNLRSTPSECKCKTNTTPPSDTDPTCTSGGIGATSCSIATNGTVAGCSVSCDAEHQFYACCIAGSEN